MTENRWTVVEVKIDNRIGTGPRRAVIMLVANETGKIGRVTIDPVPIRGALTRMVSQVIEHCLDREPFRFQEDEMHAMARAGIKIERVS